MLQAGLMKFALDARIRLTVLLLVLLLLAEQLSVLFWWIYPPANFDNRVILKTATQSQQPDIRQKSQRELAGDIVGTYLFGRPVSEPVAAVVESAPKTRLNYRLRGIYYSEESSASFAIVEIKPTQTRHYYVGEELEKKIILSAVRQDHVLIDRYGKIERLDLQKSVVLLPDKVVTSARSLNSADSATTRLLQNYKRRYVNNPMALARRFRAIPVQENGQNIGFRLQSMRGEKLLKQLNFDEKDVFTEINGIALDKPFQALDALKSLATARSISVTILRNGNKQTLNYHL